MTGSSENPETYKDSKENPMYLKGYYDTSHDIKWRKQNTAVYMHAIETRTPLTNLLGIQYWFYYPFHDDPQSDPKDSHPHDWWYVWIVYDEADHKPYQAIYDFHHVVRVKNWNQIQKENFHPKVWCDAGGHRSLYAIGVDQPIVHNTWIENPPDSSLEYYATWLSSSGVLRSDPSPLTDEIFGVMIDGLGRANKLASWRGASRQIQDDLLGAVTDYYAPGGFREGTTLTVETFKKVYIWGVEPDVNPRDGLPDRNKDYYVHCSGDTKHGNVDESINEWQSAGGTLPWLSWNDPSKQQNSVYEAWVWKTYTKTTHTWSQESATRGWAWNEALIS
ncbi:MAG: hypothetical protein WC974_07020 [Thermoplasmata archaeon]